MECVDRLPLLIWHCLHHSPSIKEKPQRRRQHLARLADHPSPSRSSLLELSRFPRMCESESNANPFIILSIFIVNNQVFLAIPWSKMAKKNRFLLPRSPNQPIPTVFFFVHWQFSFPHSLSGNVLLPAAEVPRVCVRHRLRVPARLPSPHRPPPRPPQDQPVSHSGHYYSTKAMVNS